MRKLSTSIIQLALVSAVYTNAAYSQEINDICDVATHDEPFTSNTLQFDSQGRLGHLTKIDDSCGPYDILVENPGGKVSTCVNGKMVVTGKIGSERVNLDVKLHRGKEIAEEVHFEGLDGEPRIASVSSQVPYTAAFIQSEKGNICRVLKTVGSGYEMWALPRLTKDGKVLVKLVFTLNVVQINKSKSNDKLDFPEVKRTGTSSEFVVKDGETVSIPFGPDHTISVKASIGEKLHVN